MKSFWLVGVVGVLFLLSGAQAQEPKAIPPGTPVTITVAPAQPAAPDVSISLLKRTGHVTPCKSKCARTGGGNIDVQQPSPDTIVVTMSGVAVAYGNPVEPGRAGMTFQLEQLFEVSFDKPSVKAAKLTIEGRVIGVLRSQCKGGTAEESGCATVAGNGIATSLDMPSHSVSSGENLSVNDHEGPVTMPVTASKYTLNQTFNVLATMPKTVLGKAPSVEFAPDPALDPLWISSKEPFHGIAKKDFGFQIIVKVSPEEAKEPEKGPAKVTKMRTLPGLPIDVIPPSRR